MFTSNPFAALSASIPPAVMQGYIVAMIVMVAGGTLFGFTGLLLAVPVAAVLGVLVRFLLERYLAGEAYRGRGPGPRDSGGGTA